MSPLQGTDKTAEMEQKQQWTIRKFTPRSEHLDQPLDALTKWPATERSAASVEAPARGQP